MKLTTIHTGNLKLDGGAMFGIVPRTVWSKLNPPDDKNLCTWAMRALLVEPGDGRRIVIDTGIGNKQDEKFRRHFEPHGEESLFTSLAAAGCSRESVTDCLITHLHFDHVGGALWKNDISGEIEPAFPNSTYWVNQKHLEWALNPNIREKGSFLPENFVPLLEQNRLQFVNEAPGDHFAPGMRFRFTHGHTEKMALVYLEINGKTVVYCADTLPSHFHLGLAYGMAYDIRPLEGMEEKAKLLEEAAIDGHILFFEHDPVMECATVRREPSGKFQLDQTGTLASILLT